MDFSKQEPNPQATYLQNDTIMRNSGKQATRAREQGNVISYIDEPPIFRMSGMMSVKLKKKTM